MIIFGLQDLNKARHTIIKYIIIACIMTILFVVCIYEILQVQTRQNYIGWLILCIILTIVYSFVLLFLFSTKYRRTYKYYKLCKSIHKGNKYYINGKFVSYDLQIIGKDSVEFVSINIIDCSNNVKTLLIAKTKQQPVLQIDDKVQIECYSNMVVELVKID